MLVPPDAIGHAVNLRRRRPARVVFAAGIAGTLLLLIPAPSSACSWAPGITIDQVVAASPDGVVTTDDGELGVVGIVEHEVAWHAPALIPVTSERSGFVRVRSWGDPGAHAWSLAAEESGAMPYLGGVGSSCGRVRTPPRGASIVTLVVDEGHPRGRPVTPAGEPFTFFHEEGLSPDDVAALSRTFGAPTPGSMGVGPRVGAFTMAWGPHLFAVVSIVGSVVFAIWRLSRRRPVATGAAGDGDTGGVPGPP